MSDPSTVRSDLAVTHAMYRGFVTRHNPHWYDRPWAVETDLTDGNGNPKWQHFESWRDLCDWVGEGR